jgi:hypothetical protein
MPVVFDPQTRQFIDIQTGQVVAEPKDSNGAGAASTKPDPNKSGPSSSTNPGGSNPSGKKGDDAKLK